MTNPVYDQIAFRGYADDGVPGSATPKAAVNTGWSQNVDENFRVRHAVEETINKLQNNIQVTYQYDLNSSGTFSPVTASTPIQPAASPHYADEDADNVQRVSTGGTFTGGVLNEDAQLGVTNQVDHLGNDIWEFESCFTIDSAQVGNNDTIELQVLYEGAVLDVYTATPTITVVEATVITQTINQVTETDAAQAVALEKRRLVNIVSETDLAQPITVKAAIEQAVGQVTETDLAQAVSAVKVAGVGQVAETDLAQPFAWNPKTRLVSIVSESDLAQTIARLKTMTVGQSLETDLAQALGALKQISVGQVTEADIAQALSAAKVLAVGQVSETDLAHAITVAGAIVVAVNQVFETDLAQSISWAPKHRLVGQATETEIVQAMSALKTLGIGQVTELDTAQSITVAGAIVVALGIATETDTAQAIGKLKTATVAQVTETDLAQAVSALKALGIGQATETDEAQSIAWAPKIRIVGQATETDTALAIALIAGVIQSYTASLKANISPTEELKSQPSPEEEVLIG